jgi:hypothetical protein
MVRSGQRGDKGGWGERRGGIEWLVNKSRMLKVRVIQTTGRQDKQTIPVVFKKIVSQIFAVRRTTRSLRSYCLAASQPYMWTTRVLDQPLQASWKSWGLMSLYKTCSTGEHVSGWMQVWYESKCCTVRFAALFSSSRDLINRIVYEFNVA